MLKNQSNAALQTQWYMMGSYHEILVSKDPRRSAFITKIERFIENCPLKIKRIKIEGFV
tara:strand:+ start:1030 stop:1206 length:177 start_codon:yes stop_codon:yes gene_type:complete